MQTVWQDAVANPWAVSGLATLLFFTLVWLLSLLLRDSSIVDIFWGLGFIAIAWIAVAAAPGAVRPRAWLLGTLVTLWGLRLAAHIFWRNRGRGEDARYRAWRDRAGASWWWRSYFKVFLLQAVVMWLVAVPIVAVATRPAQPVVGWLDLLAVAVWTVGFVFEAGGDAQLARFKADPRNKGRLMTAGLWRYTRHPNYFGDSTVWWGHYLLAVAAGAWWSIVSPALMMFLLLRVSGVTMLETTLREVKPGYREYAESTSTFFPMPPRRPR